jgi:hypothetical protein
MGEPSLYDVLKSSYKDKKKQEINLKKFGYERDNNLSSSNHAAYYNPTNKNLLFSVTGTHNLSDWGTDLMLSAGH